MLEEPKTMLNRNYKVYYNREIGKIQIVYSELTAPSDNYEFIESMDHNPAESYQVLRNRALVAVSNYDPGLNINEATDISFIDEAPYGIIDTGKEDKHDEPDEKPKKVSRKNKTKE